MRKKQPDASMWRKSFYGHLALARISNSPTILSNVLVGMTLAGGTVTGGITGPVVLAMGMFYTAGMYLNDVLDYPLDCQERPERPLPSGLISLPVARVVVMMLFLTGSLLLGAIGQFPLLGGLVLIALITCYNRWHASNPLSPLLMALCRSLVYITAFLACSWHLLADLLLPVGCVGLYVLSLTAIAKAEKRSRNVHIVMVALLFLPVVYGIGHFSWLSLSLLLFFLIWVGYSLSFLYRPKPLVGRTVGNLIAGISLLDGLILATIGNLPGILVALMAFALTLLLQRFIKGT